MRALLFAVAALVVPAALTAQTGVIVGSVKDSTTGEPVAGARITVEGTALGTSTSPDGRFRMRNVRPGRYVVKILAMGYRPTLQENITVSSGRAVRLEFLLSSEVVELPEIIVVSKTDPLLDPRVTETMQLITANDLRELPVTTLDEALALQAGVVGGSYRGGRPGQESFVIDGLGVKNRLDASTGALGISVPTVALEEATLVTNGFSAKYGHALSGVITVVTREGGDEIAGSLRYESDRLLPDGSDVGLDRVTFSVGGPTGLGRVKFFTVLDAQSRIDDDPVNAPDPTDPQDPRSEQPSLLPHNSGERYDLMGKLSIPLGSRHTLRLLGVASQRNRLLFDPQLKYSPAGGPAERISGTLALAHLQRISDPVSISSTLIDFRVGFFEKETLRSVLLNEPDPWFGAFTGGDFDFAGEHLAETVDSIAGLEAIDGFEVPDYALSPWGVKGFFMTASPRGELAHSRFQEVRAQLDMVFGRGLDADIKIGGEFVRQHVETFTRLESYRSVAEGAPVPRRSTFRPFAAAGYAEVEQRVEELTLAAGIRVDAFDARSGADTGQLGSKVALSPRFALSTELTDATVVVSIGRFVQAPDFQFLVDAAFDDTLRTGRFRRGNPGLGFETSWQYEFSVRYRPTPITGVKVGVYVKRFDGLISSVPVGFDPDSSVFANADFADVKGFEVTLEREFRNGVGARATYVLQDAKATATDAFAFFRQLRISPIGDTIFPASVEIPLDFDRRHSLLAILRSRVSPAAGAILGGLEAAGIVKWSSGLPFTRTNLTGDSILGIPNGERLPPQFTFDLMLRRTLELGGLRLGVYVDVRNVTDRRNVVAVRRDTGSPEPGEPQVNDMARLAFLEHSEPIPYESQRYRPEFDLDADGLISGPEELLPLYQRAARDFLQPLFAFGPPRLFRIGTEILF